MTLAKLAIPVICSVAVIIGYCYGRAEWRDFAIVVGIWIIWWQHRCD